MVFLLQREAHLCGLGKHAEQSGAAHVDNLGFNFVNGAAKLRRAILDGFLDGLAAGFNYFVQGYMSPYSAKLI